MSVCGRFIILCVVFCLDIVCLLCVYHADVAQWLCCCLSPTGGVYVFRVCLRAQVVCRCPTFVGSVMCLPLAVRCRRLSFSVYPSVVTSGRVALFVCGGVAVFSWSRCASVGASGVLMCGLTPAFVVGGCYSAYLSRCLFLASWGPRWCMHEVMYLVALCRLSVCSSLNPNALGVRCCVPLSLLCLLHVLRGPAALDRWGASCDIFLVS